MIQPEYVNDMEHLSVLKVPKKFSLVWLVVAEKWHGNEIQMN